MRAFLITIFVVTLCGDVTFGLAISHADVLPRPGSELNVLSLRSDLVLLGISMIATAVTGFGTAILNKIERLLAVMEGSTAAREISDPVSHGLPPCICHRAEGEEVPSRARCRFARYQRLCGKLHVSVGLKTARILARLPW